MKKILGLSLVACSIFSMQLDLVNFEKKANILQKKILHHDVFKFNDSHNVQSKPDKGLIQPASVFVPHQLGSVELYHDKKGFHVLQDDKKYEIKKYFTDPVLRDITRKQLKSFLKGGYLAINQMDDGEFSLKAKGRINGGGPIFGAFMYWLTKVVCYGTIAAVGTAMVAGGGSVKVGTKKSSTPTFNHNKDFLGDHIKSGLTNIANNAVVPLATTGMAIGSEIVTKGSIRIVSTLPMTSILPVAAKTTGIGITAVSEGIKAAGLVSEATALVSVGGMSTSGTGLGIAASIEAFALKVGLFFGMTPTL